MKILIVDDHATNRKLLRVTLEAEGLATVEAADGLEGLCVLEAEREPPVDAIISDIFMPGMDGFRFCHAVRKSERFGHLPFVIYTSTYTSASDEKLALEAGADRYIRKPCPTATLIGALHEVIAARERALERPQPHGELEVTREYSDALVRKLEEKNAGLERAMVQQKSVADLSQLALATADLEALLDQAALMVTTALDVEECVVWEALPDGETLRLLAASGRWACGGGSRSVTGASRADDRGHHGDEPARDVATLRLVEVTDTFGSVTTDRLAVAIPGLDRPLGFLEARTAAACRFKAEDIHFLEAIANVLAAALRRQQAEEAIQNEARFSSENPNPVLRMSQGGTLTYANKASELLLAEWGFEPGCQVPAFWQEQISAAYGGQSSRMLDVESQDRVYSFVIVPIPGAGYVNLYARDVTERRQAEQLLDQRVRERTAELQASEERFRQLAENIHEVFWMVEPDTRRVLYVSPAYDAIWGRSRRELYDRPESLLDTIHPDDRGRLARDFAAHWRAYDGEFRILHVDGTSRWIRLRSFPVCNDRGEVYRLAGIATDCTEQKAAEAALLQSERLAIAGRMAASLAHEINNPLQAAIGCLDLAQEAVEHGEDLSAYLSTAQQGLQRTARIVSQLRALGRPVQGGYKEPTDLNSLLNDVLVLNKKQLSTRRVEVIWEPEEALPLLMLMPDPIHQVFLNLVINAMDAMSKGGQLRLSTSRTASPAGIRVAIADTGEGIPPDALPHIFEAFYSTKVGGLGVGLFVSHGIVQRHGGSIEVESQPGAGTTFTVWLPADNKTPQTG